MKIGLVQHNPITGDFPRNVRLLVDGFRECVESGADLVIASSCALEGLNHAEMLLEKKSFQLQSLDALTYLAHEIESTNIPYLVGAYLKKTNCMALLNRGAIQEIYELNESNTITINNIHLQILNEETPLDFELNDKEENIFVYLNSETELDDALSKLPTEQFYGHNILIVSCVGGNDHYLYQGDTSVYSAKKELIAKLPCCKEGTLLYDTNSHQVSGNNLIFPTTPAYKTPTSFHKIEALIMGIKDFCAKTKRNALCLEFRPKRNSLLVAYLAVQAMGRENVVAYTFNTSPELENLANSLKINLISLNINEGSPHLITTLSNALDGVLPKTATTAFTQSIHNILLKSISDELNYLQLCTIDKSRLLLNYTDDEGDICGDYAPLGDLSDSEVEKIYHTVKKLPKIPHTQLPVPDDLIDLLLTGAQNYTPSDLIKSKEIPYDENLIRMAQRCLRKGLYNGRRHTVAPWFNRDGIAFLDMPLAQNFND